MKATIKGEQISSILCKRTIGMVDNYATVYMLHMIGMVGAVNMSCNAIQVMNVVFLVLYFLADDYLFCSFSCGTLRYGTLFLWLLFQLCFFILLIKVNSTKMILMFYVIYS